MVGCVQVDIYVLVIYIGCGGPLELVQFGLSSVKVSPRQPLSLNLLSQVNIGIHFATILEPFDLSWVVTMAVYMI